MVARNQEEERLKQLTRTQQLVSNWFLYQSSKNAKVQQQKVYIKIYDDELNELNSDYNEGTTSIGHHLDELLRMLKPRKPSSSSELQPLHITFTT